MLGIFALQLSQFSGTQHLYRLNDLESDKQLISVHLCREFYMPVKLVTFVHLTLSRHDVFFDFIFFIKDITTYPAKY